jgi:hypothetical protein
MHPETYMYGSHGFEHWASISAKFLDVVRIHVSRLATCSDLPRVQTCFVSPNDYTQFLSVSLMTTELCDIGTDGAGTTPFISPTTKVEPSSLPQSDGWARKRVPEKLQGEEVVKERRRRRVGETGVVSAAGRDARVSVATANGFILFGLVAVASSDDRSVQTALTADRVLFCCLVL